MCGQECCHFPAVLVVLDHAHFQGLYTAQHQPAFKRRQNRAGGFLDKCELLSLVVARANNHAPQTIAVAVEEFGGRVNHQDRKSTCLNSSHTVISYAVFCLKKKKKKK